MQIHGIFVAASFVAVSLWEKTIRTPNAYRLPFWDAIDSTETEWPKPLNHLHDDGFDSH